MFLLVKTLAFWFHFWSIKIGFKWDIFMRYCVLLLFCCCDWVYSGTNVVRGLAVISVQLEIEDATRKLRLGDFLGSTDPAERLVMPTQTLCSRVSGGAGAHRRSSAASAVRTTRRRAYRPRCACTPACVLRAVLARRLSCDVWPS